MEYLYFIGRFIQLTHQILSVLQKKLGHFLKGLALLKIKLQHVY